MIFKPELAKLVLQGRKTQVRRTGSVCRYQAGKSYAMQPGRGKPASARITVLDVRQEPLGEISLRDVRREGFVTTAEFFDHWEASHDSVDREESVWVISFVLGDQTDTPRLLAARPGAPHGDYVSQSYLALKDAGEALSAGEQERYSKLASARDDLLRRERIKATTDRIGQELDSLRDYLRTDPSKTVERAIASVERTTGALKRSA